MDCSSKLARLFLTACLALSLGHSSTAIAEADEDAHDHHGLEADSGKGGAISENALGIEDDLFRPGGSCAALAYVSGSQLAELIRLGFSDDRHSFCFPEEPSECGDYTSLLQGRGRLTTGEDGYHCNLQINP